MSVYQNSVRLPGSAPDRATTTSLELARKISWPDELLMQAHGPDLHGGADLREPPDPRRA